jgi:putative methyltransferase (TIGR04325 family)
MAREWIARWAPPALRRAANRWLGRSIRYRGPYPDLEQARRHTTGYDADDILATVMGATREVLSGKARYEQDGRAFLDEPPTDPALAGLLLGAALSQGRLCVLDFGGSLGSHYLRWTNVLTHFKDLRWCVVEQSNFVRAGRELHAADPRIQFEFEVEAARAIRPNVVLASGVLQFIDDPYAMLGSLASLGSEVIIIDRTPFCEGGVHQFFSQHVPKQLQKSSYPLQSLSRDRVEEVLRPAYVPAFEYATRDEPIRTRHGGAVYRGSVWKLRR